MRVAASGEDLRAAARLLGVGPAALAPELLDPGARLLVGDGAAAAARHAEGWRFVAIGSDATLLAAAVAAELGRARPSTPGTRGGQT